jgi:hypothetical protein
MTVELERCLYCKTVIVFGPGVLNGGGGVDGICAFGCVYGFCGRCERELSVEERVGVHECGSY